MYENPFLPLWIKQFLSVWYPFFFCYLCQKCLVTWPLLAPTRCEWFISWLLKWSSSSKTKTIWFLFCFHVPWEINEKFHLYKCRYHVFATSLRDTRMKVYQNKNNDRNDFVLWLLKINEWHIDIDIVSVVWTQLK